MNMNDFIIDESKVYGTLGHRMKYERVIRELSQERAAELCCVDRVTYPHWERGTHKPQVMHWARLGEFLKISPWDIGNLLNQPTEGKYKAAKRKE